MFLSHTADLRELPRGRSFVDAAEAAIRHAGDGVIDMAYFAARDREPSESCVSMVARADVYVGIVGLRYGTPVRDLPDRSYTELEFGAATDLQMPRLVFLLDERSAAVPAALDDPEDARRQERFRRRLQESGITTATVATPGELEIRVYQALVELPETALSRPALTAQAVENWWDRDAPRLARARQDLIDQVRRHWVEAELDRSLERLARIELGLAERRSAVADPLRTVLRRADEPDRPLPRATPIGRTFRDLGGQLLILGQPGAGKTTLLLELARSLLVRARRDASERVPVVLHLSSWAVRRGSLHEWLVSELNQRYGVVRWLGDLWVTEERVVLLLDGLDEVDAQHRAACVDAINRFHRDHGQLPLAVCSRTHEYDVLGQALELRDAIVILPLEREEVERYLDGAGPALEGVRTALRDDALMWELLTAPLFLNVVALTYRGRSAAEVREAGPLERRREAVLDDYVRAMLDSPQAATTPDYPHDRVVHWLRWLAVSLGTHAQSVFYLDLLQPDWLPSRFQRRLVTLGVPVAVGALDGLFSALVIAVLAHRELDAVPRVAFATVVGLVATLSVAVALYVPAIEPTEELGWSWTKLRGQALSSLGAGVVAGLVLSACLGAVDVLSGALGGIANGGEAAATVGRSLRVGLFVAEVSLGMCAGAALVIALAAGIDERYAIDPPIAGRGTQVSRRNWLVSTLTLGLASGLLLTVASQHALVLVAGAYPLLLGRGGVEEASPLVLTLLGPATGIVDGFAVGLLLRLILPSRRTLALGRGLAMGLAVATAVGLVQWGAVQASSAAGIELQFEFVPSLQGVPVWPFAGTLAGLIVAFGGSLRMGMFAAAVLAVAGGLVLPDQRRTLAIFSIYSTESVVLLTVGLSLVIGMRHGGSAFLRHWVLRWLLVRDGLAPMDYIAFLDHATRLNLLRRHGGGYEFIHRLVQEHFARR